MPCGKRLAPFIPKIILKLEAFSEIEMDSLIKQKLHKISASTIDRLLKPIKEKLRIGKGRSFAKPGILLKHQIPIKTFSYWKDSALGYLEADLVGHDGGMQAKISVLALILQMLQHAGTRLLCNKE